MVSFDILGDIAVIKEGLSKSGKLKLAKNILKNKSIKTVVEKVGNVKGRLRTINVKHVLGEKNKIAVVRENGCVFKFDIEKCYYSSRLSNERKIMVEKVRKKDNVLVMFAGVGVFPIVIKKLKECDRVVGIEIGRECCKWFKENNKLNKVNVEIIQGDVKKNVLQEKFDVILMARPNLKESFLEYALRMSKKGTKIYYHAFGNVDEIERIVSDLVSEGKKFRKKLKVLRVERAGDIAPYKFRFRVEILVG